ncbi:MAG TPA: lanthionine synthetase LanC family protein [Thermoleophilaceae bacterium]
MVTAAHAPLHEDLAAVASAVSASPGTDPVPTLASLLYRDHYVRPHGRAPITVLDAVTDRDFQESLIRAARPGVTWEPGWRRAGAEGDRVTVVAPHGVRFWVAPERVRGVADGDPDGCAVLVPTVRRALAPGYFAVIGREAWDAPDEPAGMVRLYWHVREQAAAALLATVQSALDGARVPFKLKVLRSPAAYRRADAAVLYVPRHRFEEARGPLRGVYAELAGRLRPSVPLFTKRLAPGLALAEDPGLGESFGQHRCRLVARALWRAHEDGHRDAASKRAAIAAAFAEAGLDPARPHLAPGSEDGYEPLPGKAAPVAEHRDSPPSDDADPAELLAAAGRLGQTIVADALWDRRGEACGWIGRSSFGRPGSVALFVPRSTGLGPGLYDGTSGVALFLAELFARTGEPEFARTARGAVAFALARARGERPSSTSLGLYSGVPGTLLAAWRVARLLGDEPPDGGDADLLAGSLSDHCADARDDLLVGRAGEVLALLALARETGRAEYVAHAERIGRRLGRGAVTYAGHDSPAAGAEPPLTGISHGAAGVGVALLELAVAGDYPEALDAAHAAFEYEQGLFDADAGNWPDLRTDELHPPGERRYAVAWCHGAPGVALSRLRARELDPARRAWYDEHVTAGLDTTRAELERRASLDVWDLTPCHGVAGLVEALWIGGHVLGRPDFTSAARRAAGAIARLPEAEMRSGTPCGGPSPALMLGTAGVGYQLLRLADAGAVPSVLCGLWHAPV